MTREEKIEKIKALNDYIPRTQEIAEYHRLSVLDYGEKVAKMVAWRDRLKAEVATEPEENKKEE